MCIVSLLLSNHNAAALVTCVLALSQLVDTPCFAAGACSIIYVIEHLVVHNAFCYM